MYIGVRGITAYTSFYLPICLHCSLSTFSPLPASLWLFSSLYLSLSILLYSLTLSSRITLSDNPEVALLIKFSVDLRD